MVARKERIKELALKHTLKSLMKEKQVTAKDLAFYADTHLSVVHNWLNGSIPQDLHAIAKIATRLNVPFYYLLFGCPEPQESVDFSKLFDLEDVASGLYQISLKKLVLKGKS